MAKPSGSLYLPLSQSFGCPSAEMRKNHRSVGTRIELEDNAGHIIRHRIEPRVALSKASSTILRSVISRIVSIAPRTLSSGRTTGRRSQANASPCRHASGEKKLPRKANFHRAAQNHTAWISPLPKETADRPVRSALAVERDPVFEKFPLPIISSFRTPDMFSIALFQATTFLTRDRWDHVASGRNSMILVDTFACRVGFCRLESTWIAKFKLDPGEEQAVLRQCCVSHSCAFAMSSIVVFWSDQFPEGADKARETG